MGRGRITVTPGFLFLMALVQLCGPAGAPAPGPGRVRAPRAWPPGGHLGAGRIGAAPAADGCGGGDPDGAAHVLSGGAGSGAGGPAANLAAAWLCCRAEGGALFAGLNLALGCFNLLPVGRLDGDGRCTVCCPCPSGRLRRRRRRSWTRVFIAFLLALGVLLIGWGGSFTLLLVALWLLAKEKEGKKGRNRSCQGLQKRVKWFLHSK